MTQRTPFLVFLTIALTCGCSGDDKVAATSSPESDAAAGGSSAGGSSSGGAPNAGAGGKTTGGAPSATGGIPSAGGTTATGGKPSTGGKRDGGHTDSGPTDSGPPFPADASDATECTATGGSVVTLQCCGATSEFPDMCVAGPCGCSPSNSHPVQGCSCGNGMCFEPGKGCRAR